MGKDSTRLRKRSVSRGLLLGIFRQCYPSSGEEGSAGGTHMDRPLVEANPGELTSPERLEGLVRAWLEEVRSRTGSERTASEYRSILERFLNAIGWDAALRTPSTAQVHAFASGPEPRDNHRSKEKPSSSTVTVRLAALRSYRPWSMRARASALSKSSLAWPSESSRPLTTPRVLRFVRPPSLRYSRFSPC